jgi:RNA polymerase-binding transcription factor DksA
MTMPQPSVDTTISTETLIRFEIALWEALSFHESRLEGTPEFDDISMAMRRRSELAHTEIVAALSRIQEGSFGSCERCGAAIDSDRLEAMPHTPHCRSCAT